jgi:hypothetical protein
MTVVPIIRSLLGTILRGVHLQTVPSLLQQQILVLLALDTSSTSIPMSTHVTLGTKDDQDALFDGTYLQVRKGNGNAQWYFWSRQSYQKFSSMLHSIFPT